MVLYIDETENNSFFIVAGLLATSSEETENAYRKFKKSIKRMKIEDKYRSQVYTEFKSTLLDRRYKRIKIKMLESIAEIEPTIIYSVYQKKVSKMNQVQKEAVYITLLTSILTHLKNETTIVFDRFGKTDFENNIMSLARTIPNVVSIYPEDSQRQHGLQFADNICSVLRRYKSDDDEFNYYGVIKKYVKEV